MDWSSVEKLSYLYVTWSGIKTTAGEKELQGKKVVHNYLDLLDFYSLKSPLTLEGF